MNTYESYSTKKIENFTPLFNYSTSKIPSKHKLIQMSIETKEASSNILKPKYSSRLLKYLREKKTSFIYYIRGFFDLINNVFSNKLEKELISDCHDKNHVKVNTLIRKHPYFFSKKINKLDNKEDLTLLMIACNQGNINLVNSLLKIKNIAVNTASPFYKNTPLMLACHRLNKNENDLACMAIVKSLLQNEAIDPNKKDCDDQTPLMFAFENNLFNLVKILLKSVKVIEGINRSNNNQLQLLSACYLGDDACIQELLTDVTQYKTSDF